MRNTLTARRTNWFKGVQSQLNARRTRTDTRVGGRVHLECQIGLALALARSLIGAQCSLVQMGCPCKDGRKDSPARQSGTGQAWTRRGVEEIGEGECILRRRDPKS